MMHDGLRAFVEVVERDVALMSRSAPAQDSASVAHLVRSWGKLAEGAAAAR